MKFDDIMLRAMMILAFLLGLTVMGMAWTFIWILVQIVRHV